MSSEFGILNETVDVNETVVDVSREEKHATD